eukprot:scaffold604_cov384-Prasinococcus_capsulatus_cf.AAC.4
MLHHLRATSCAAQAYLLRAPRGTGVTGAVHRGGRMQPVHGTLRARRGRVAPGHHPARQGPVYSSRSQSMKTLTRSGGGSELLARVLRRPPIRRDRQ